MWAFCALTVRKKFLLPQLKAGLQSWAATPCSFSLGWISPMAIRLLDCINFQLKKCKHYVIYLQSIYLHDFIKIYENRNLKWRDKRTGTLTFSSSLNNRLSYVYSTLHTTELHHHKRSASTEKDQPSINLFHSDVYGKLIGGIHLALVLWFIHRSKVTQLMRVVCLHRKYLPGP